MPHGIFTCVRLASSRGEYTLVRASMRPCEFECRRGLAVNPVTLRASNLPVMKLSHRPIVQSLSHFKYHRLMQNETLTLKELLAQHEELQNQLKIARQREAEIVLAEIVRKMGEYKITLTELMGKDNRPAAPAAAPLPKYRDATSGATWSGRGRAPHWIADKNRELFLTSP
jgi:DNA-binding protein H-NS